MRGGCRVGGDAVGGEAVGSDAVAPGLYSRLLHQVKVSLDVIEISLTHQPDCPPHTLATVWCEPVVAQSV